MSTRFILRTMIATFCWIASSSMFADDNGYYFRSWDYHATVHSDNTMDIEERLEATFLEPRHGIYHYLLNSYYDQHLWEGEYVTYSYNIETDNISVEGDEFLIDTDVSNVTNIRIGSADYTITGPKTYVIRYRMTYPDDRCTSYDQLFHTVMAADVSTHTERFTFCLDFDKPLPDNVVNGGLNIYSGSQSSRKNSLNVQCEVSPTSISGTVNDLPAANAITLYAMLPEGYYENPKSVPSYPFWISLSLTFALLAWIVYDLLLNRRRRKPVTVVNFYPPNDISSAEVGTIIDDSADIEDITSLIPWLAHKGYISISEQPDSKGRIGKHATLTLTVTRLPDDGLLPAYAYEFLQALFGNKMSIGQEISMSDLKKDLAEKLNKAQKTLSKEFKGERRLTRLSIACLLPYLGVTMVTLTFALSSRIMQFSPECLLISFLFIIMPSIFFGIWSITASARTHIASRLSRLFRWAVIIIAESCFFGIWMVNWEPQNSFMPLWAGQIIFTLVAVIILLMGRYNADTPYRTEMMGQLLGLRQFIQKAEMPQLKALVDEDPTYFYGVLPYAMVFGLSDKWATLFKDIEMPQPQWFSSPHPITATQSLTSSIKNSIDEMHNHIAQQAAATANGGSNISHGGFSGGGGGAGGTGSW